jgi:hypothetical protein
MGNVRRRRQHDPLRALRTFGNHHPANLNHHFQRNHPGVDRSAQGVQMTTYPTAGALRAIGRYSIRSRTDLRGLLASVRRDWMYQDRFILTRRRLYLSTGGWSGNEDLIDALQHNHMFWATCWLRSERGGHHVFDLTRAPK